MARIDTIRHFCEDLSVAIKYKSGITDGIKPNSFDELIFALPTELTTEQYMRLLDLSYPYNINENNYTEEQINKVDELLNLLGNLKDYNEEVTD